LGIAVEQILKEHDIYLQELEECVCLYKKIKALDNPDSEEWGDVDDQISTALNKLPDFIIVYSDLQIIASQYSITYQQLFNRIDQIITKFNRFDQKITGNLHQLKKIIVGDRQAYSNKDLERMYLSAAALIYTVKPITEQETSSELINILAEKYQLLGFTMSDFIRNLHLYKNDILFKEGLT
jgi:hypothetical protein